MNILVIGGTGHVGSLVVQELADRHASARVLTTNPDKCTLPKGITPVKGDLLDPASLRAALDGIDTMFLLNAVSPSELTQALLALDLAQESKVKHVVYFSQIKLDWPDCPHAVAKAGAEALIRYHDLPATILRPAYFFQNDTGLKQPILGGTYPIPIGSVGADMVDMRDIAAVAAVTILNPDAIGSDPIIELVGPDNITGERAAEIWTQVTGRLVTYGGDEIGKSFEAQLAQNMPGWQAHDLAAMFRGCQREGMRGKPGAVDRLASLLGRPLRSYHAFVAETYQHWQHD
ncbi:NmrA family NAD(P)-binding protein [Hymenobacter sp. H14-R3]|uniref:SDR family oxidoreductase n=1 Tax=Hymenobacter sp. H14-R3 TaxID=3046308 RepID=UPI0024B9E9E0|nr:NmrA family NAD(P)-binding protein [Hymenobacter sp. H14-R3]MDJ0367812.1 NmrA family NAD(P)-binding protein [Hymenobacter sp. H14-R3]